MENDERNVKAFLFVCGLILAVWGGVTLWLSIYNDGMRAGAIAHHEGRVAVTVLPDGSKVVTTVKENSK
jgi:hypothetical protein